MFKVGDRVKYIGEDMKMNRGRTEYYIYNGAHAVIKNASPNGESIRVFPDRGDGYGHFTLSASKFEHLQPEEEKVAAEPFDPYGLGKSASSERLW